MKNVIFNESKDIEYIIESGEIGSTNINQIISSIAKYNFSVLHMNDKKNYDNIVEWLKKYYQLYIETEFDAIIRDKINAAHKYNLLYSDNLCIYQSELDFISSVDDIKIEKVLFALLCIAKLQKNLFGYQNGKYKFPLTNIFKLARVHVPSVDRGLFMHELFKREFIGAPFIASDDSRWVNYIHEDGQPVLYISEIDFEELAYVYLNWKNKGGYTRCQVCNRIIKQSKTKPKKYCEECAKKIESENSKKRVRKFREKCNENLNTSK